MSETLFFTYGQNQGQRNAFLMGDKINFSPSVSVRNKTKRLAWARSFDWYLSMFSILFFDINLYKSLKSDTYYGRGGVLMRANVSSDYSRWIRWKLVCFVKECVVGHKIYALTVNRTQGLKIFSLALSQLSYQSYLLLALLISLTNMTIVLCTTLPLLCSTILLNVNSMEHYFSTAKVIFLSPNF